MAVVSGAANGPGTDGTDVSSESDLSRRCVGRFGWVGRIGLSLSGIRIKFASFVRARSLQSSPPLDLQTVKKARSAIAIDSLDGGCNGKPSALIRSTNPRHTGPDTDRLAISFGFRGNNPLSPEPPKYCNTSSPMINQCQSNEFCHSAGFDATRHHLITHERRAADGTATHQNTTHRISYLLQVTLTRSRSSNGMSVITANVESSFSRSQRTCAMGFELILSVSVPVPVPVVVPVPGAVAEAMDRTTSATASAEKSRTPISTRPDNSA